MAPSPADERRREPEPGAGPNWEESWYFDFALADGSFGGFARLGLRPGDGRAWWWTYLAGARRPLVAVRDHDVELPPGRALEIRASGLWAEVTVESALEHWTIGLEAFGVAMDDPAEAWATERGDPVAVGLDLEWEAGVEPGERAEGGPIPNLSSVRSYAQPCVVHGDVLIGDQRIAVDAKGWRSHSWGEHDWWSDPAAGPAWLAGHTDDGTPVSGRAGDFTVTTVARAPVLVSAADGRAAHLDRRLCRFATEDGRTGSGWCQSAAAPA